MDQQRDLTLSSTATLEQLSASLDNMSVQMQDTAASASASHQAASEGERESARWAAAVADLAAETRALRLTLDGLHQRSGEITQVVGDSRGGRANQSAGAERLDEAARAGESGRGFCRGGRRSAQPGPARKGHRDITQVVAAIAFDVGRR